MFDLILENAAGDQLRFGMGTPFSLVDIQGLNPPAATVNTSQLALMDGAKYNSAKAEMRTIDIAFAIELDPPKNRTEVYKVLKSKHYVKIIYHGEYRHVYTEGYVTSILIGYWDMKQVVTCSILCPDSYLKALQDSSTDISIINSDFYYPFYGTLTPNIVFGHNAASTGIIVDNDGDVETGMIIQLYATKAVGYPTIYDYVTGEFIRLNVLMQQYDLITIDTNAGHKTVTRLRNGVVTNLFHTVTKDSTWLQLAANGSTFVYDVISGSSADLQVNISHTDLYEGV